MHFVEADTLYGSAYLTVNNDEVYRVWIGDRGEPLIGRLTPLQMIEWKGHKQAAPDVAAMHRDMCRVNGGLVEALEAVRARLAGPNDGPSGLTVIPDAWSIANRALTRA